MPEKSRRKELLGKAIRQARVDAGLSQEKLAFAAEIDRTYVSNLETGLKSPTVEVLFRVAAALGISASELLAQVERSKNRKR